MTAYQLPDGRTVSDGMAFTFNEIQYPDNWIRLTTQEEKEQIGLVELPPPEWYDQRFYWAPDQPKDLLPLQEEYIEHVKRNANSILSDTDWLVIREADNGTDVPPAIKTWRQSVREAAGVKVAAIRDAADTPALAAYVTGSDYAVWPEQQA